MLNSYKKKIRNKAIFYLVYSPEQCAYNELSVSGFEPTACNEWV